MANDLALSDIENIQAYDAEKRFEYLIKEVIKNDEIWILMDEHGCVMLNTDDEDCVPVWPNKEFAQLWATEEWSECSAEAISLNKWFSRWTIGLADDELSVVVFPNKSEEGIIVFPEELEDAIKHKEKKINVKLL